MDSPLSAAAALKTWARGKFLPDGVSLQNEARAGLITAALALPQAIAFAGLAGLPPQMGLWACVIPLVIAALVGDLPHLVTGPIVSVSLVMSSTLQLYATPGSGTYVRDVAVVTLGVGLLQLLIAAAGMARVIDWIRAWGTEAITNAVAVALLLSQVPAALGVTPAILPNWQQAWTALLDIHGANPSAAGLFIVTFGLGIALGRTPWPIVRQLRLAIMLVLATALSWLLGLQLSQVGYAPLSIPWTPIELDAQTRAWLPQWAGLMLDLAVLSLLQTVVLARAFKMRNPSRPVSLRREALAQGVANVVVAFTGGYVGGASFNRSITHERLGARCALAIVFAAVFLVLAVAAAPSLIAQIPYPAMAAMLALTAVNMFELRQARTRPFIATCSALVVACGVFIGIGSAVALAFAIAVAQHLAATAEHRKD